jgi:hypothetical protein
MPLNCGHPGGDLLCEFDDMGGSAEPLKIRILAAFHDFAFNFLVPSSPPTAGNALKVDISSIQILHLSSQPLNHFLGVAQPF